jgi:hypothetical protein
LWVEFLMEYGLHRTVILKQRRLGLKFCEAAVLHVDKLVYWISLTSVGPLFGAYTYFDGKG